MSASEASARPAMNLHLQGIETETYVIFSKISEYSNCLNDILKAYDAKSPENLEKMIELGEIEAHPAYEDYLSALSYEQNITDLKKILANLVNRI